MRPVVGLLPVFLFSARGLSSLSPFLLDYEGNPTWSAWVAGGEAITGLPRKTSCSRVLGLCPGGAWERNYLYLFQQGAIILPNAGVL